MKTYEITEEQIKDTKEEAEKLLNAKIV